MKSASKVLASARVATLHIRNVPVHVYEALRVQAERNGRSLNAEVIDVLGRGVESWRGNEQWWAEFEELCQRIAAQIPADAPTPEELIREDRDSR
jgi:plasmid stability protein